LYPSILTWLISDIYKCLLLRKTDFISYHNFPIPSIR